MWYLKFKYKHSDCIYLTKLKELGLSVHFYFLGFYEKGNYTYTTALQHILGEESKVKKYIRYMKNHSKVVNIETHDNVIITTAKHKKEIELYSRGYDQMFMHPSPAYLSEDGFEIIEIAFWSRKPLQDFIKTLEKNKTTTHFEILRFEEKKMEDIYVSKLLPKLPSKQEEAIRLAFQNGYYDFPRKTDLNKLAKITKISKPTFRENLRKAEAKILPKLISK